VGRITKRINSTYHGKEKEGSKEGRKEEGSKEEAQDRKARVSLLFAKTPASGSFCVKGKRHWACAIMLDTYA